MNYVEATDTSLRKTGQIKLHGASGFAGMRKAGALVAKCLDELTDIVKAGVPTSRIDEFVRDFAFSHGAYPATLMYRGYRYSTCTSINHVVCHGMPGDRALKEGDIVNIDVTFIVEGWYGDSSRMYVIGPIARKAERLIEVTYEAMMRGIAAVKPTECSNCAVSERSRVTAVQPSERIFTCGLPRLIIGSMVKNMPGFSITPSPGLPTWMMFGSSWNMRPRPWPQKSRTTLMPCGSTKLWMAWPISPVVAPGFTAAMPRIIAS
jgi:hypothetical protein